MVCYIKNEGDLPTILTMYADNWSPTSADTYLDLNWNYDSNPIDVDVVIQVTFTLSVSPDIDGIADFGFDITIVGSSS